MHHPGMTVDPPLTDRQRQFVAAARTATLATIAPSGRPRLVPVCFVLGPLEPGAAAAPGTAAPGEANPGTAAPGTAAPGTAAQRSATPSPAVYLYSPLDAKPKSVSDPHELGRVQDILVLPVATLLVDRWSEDWTELGWLRIETRAELLEPEPHEREEHAAAVTALLAKYPQYATHDLDERPIIRFRVDRVVAWGSLAG